MTKMEDMLPIMLESFSLGKTFTFPVHGTSMQPLLHTNDLVILKKATTLLKGDIVLYQRENGQFVLHRVRRVKKNMLDFVGDHQVQIEKNVLRSSCIGKVIGYKKQGKDKVYSLKGIRYKIYKGLVRCSLFRRVCSKLL